MWRSAGAARSFTPLLYGGARRRQGRDAALRALQHDVRAAPREESDGDHAGDLVELGFEAHGVADRKSADIEDDVAVVGGEAAAPHRLTAQPHDLARDVA